MSSSAPTGLLDRVVSTQQASVRRFAPRGIRRAEPALDLNVTLTLCDENEEELPNTALCLAPGDLKLVRIHVESREGTRGAPGRVGSCTLRGQQLILELSCKACPDLVIESLVEPEDRHNDAPNSLVIGREHFCGPEAKTLDPVEVWFSVEVGECPFGPVQLELRAGREPRPICALRVELQGQGLLRSAGELSPFGIDPSAEVPDNVALLCITESDVDVLSLRGFHSSAHLDAAAQLPGDGLSVAKLWARRLVAQQIAGQVSAFSRRNAHELRGWLRALLTRYPDDLVLVIVDLTSTEVPWELIDLGQHGQRRAYLGASAEVVRWIDVRDYQGRVLLNMSQSVQTGGAGRFLHGSANLEREELGLAQLRAKPFASMREVVRHLNRKPDLALLYIACHGEFVQAAGVQTPGLYQMGTLDTGQRNEQTFLELDVEQIEARPQRDLVVFVNACQSARLLYDRGNPCGLAERFLARIANGYIGTLSEVTGQHAAELGAEVLSRMASTKTGCRPARILREIRAEYQEVLLQSGEQSEDWMRFLHAFLYVYLGNPLAVIQITSTPEPQDG